MLRQQPTLWSDVFQAERGWGDSDNNDYVKHDEDEPRQGQGKQLEGWFISKMTTRMATALQTTKLTMMATTTTMAKGDDNDNGNGATGDNDDDGNGATGDGATGYDFDNDGDG